MSSNALLRGKTISTKPSPAWARSSANSSTKEKGMLDDLKEEGIVNKLGGRFKLSTLIQKRMRMLNTGARALVETRNLDRMSVVIQEILQDKIYLDNSGQVQTRDMIAGDMARRAMLGDISSD